MSNATMSKNKKCNISERAETMDKSLQCLDNASRDDDHGNRNESARTVLPSLLPHDRSRISEQSEKRLGAIRQEQCQIRHTIPIRSMPLGTQ
jgi:hypothetical protein